MGILFFGNRSLKPAVLAPFDFRRSRTEEQQIKSTDDPFDVNNIALSTEQDSQGEVLIFAGAGSQIVQNTIFIVTQRSLLRWIDLAMVNQLTPNQIEFIDNGARVVRSGATILNIRHYLGYTDTLTGRHAGEKFAELRNFVLEPGDILAHRVQLLGADITMRAHVQFGFTSI